MLRQFRRRFRGTRGEPLVAFALRVTAVSPFPEEPIEEEAYRHSRLRKYLVEPVVNLNEHDSEDLNNRN